jgi:hypothetical protein
MARAERTMLGTENPRPKNLVSPTEESANITSTAVVQRQAEGKGIQMELTLHEPHPRC